MTKFKTKIQNLNLEGVTAETWTRLVWAIIIAINQGLAIFGKEEIPFTQNEIYQVISFILSCWTLWRNHWKNNSYTKPYQEGDLVAKALEEGELPYTEKAHQPDTDHHHEVG